jgi:hypothetical protein
VGGSNGSTGQEHRVLLDEGDGSGLDSVSGRLNFIQRLRNVKDDGLRLRAAARPEVRDIKRRENARTSGWIETSPWRLLCPGSRSSSSSGDLEIRPSPFLLGGWADRQVIPQPSPGGAAAVVQGALAEMPEGEKLDQAWVGEGEGEEGVQYEIAVVIAAGAVDWIPPGNTRPWCCMGRTKVKEAGRKHRAPDPGLIGRSDSQLTFAWDHCGETLGTLKSMTPRSHWKCWQM